MISPLSCRSSGAPVALPSRYSRTAGLELDKSSKKISLLRALAVATDGTFRGHEDVSNCFVDGTDTFTKADSRN
jgi:hypothetical protein